MHSAFCAQARRLKAATPLRSCRPAARSLAGRWSFHCHPHFRQSDYAKDRGKLIVNTGLKPKGYEGKVWALGWLRRDQDGRCCAVREPATGTINIAAALRGVRQTEFGFEGLGARLNLA
ncbi:MAG: hypothetical protein J2P48_24975, partial [Alphaproteobacteria bacterium]|nr:hypothetical protein [Alphaproteobacteria bacterium]